MNLSYKEDWSTAQERILAWWEGEIVDRVAIKVVAPKSPRRPITPPADMKSRWTDPDYLIAAHEAAFESTYYGGESFPNVFVNLGPSIMGAYLGCELEHDESTGWQHPIVQDQSDWDKVSFNPGNEWWKITRQLTEAYVRAGAGKWFVSLTDLGGPTDVMSYLRTPEELCMDLIEIPEKLQEIRDNLTDLWFRLYDELYALIQREMTGSSFWMSIWSPRKSYALQCDFSCMISAQMYRDFVVPEVLAQTKWLDHSIYHLDGPGAIQHLDTLLEIPELNAIQWVPGAGAPPEKDWPDLLKRIQSAGKSLHIGVHRNDIEELLETISPKGLMIDTWCDSEEEARGLLKKAEVWTARGV